MYKTLQLFTNVQNIATIYKCTKHCNFLQMYKTLQLFTNIFTLNTKIFTSIKVIKNTYVHKQKLLKMPSSLKLGLN